MRFKTRAVTPGGCVGCPAETAENTARGRYRGIDHRNRNYGHVCASLAVPFLEVDVDFTGGVHYEYVGVHDKSRMAVSTAPVLLTVDFAGRKLKLQEMGFSSPICPGKATVYATLHASGLEPVYVSN